MSFRNGGRASSRAKPRKKEFQLKSEGGEPLMLLNQGQNIVMSALVGGFPIILPGNGSRIYCRNIVFNVHFQTLDDIRSEKYELL